jgi:hypothetical protein
MKRVVSVALLPLALGCTSDRIPNGEIVLVSGQEAGIWSQDPKPTSLKITQIGLDATETAYTELPVPATESDAPVFDMGRGGAVAFAATAADAAGTALIKGRTWLLDRVTWEGSMAAMYVSRVGVFSRPPDIFRAGLGDFPPVDIFGGQFLISAGNVENNQIRIDFYSLGLWQYYGYAYAPCLASPCQVRSLAVVDVGLAVMVGDTWAQWQNLSTAAYTTRPLPTGWTSWGDVAGGATVRNPSEGSVYIVGATRPSNPTTAVLYLSAAGEPKALSLSTPRAGAAATWINGVGLVVMGGTSDPNVAGVEILRDATSSFAPMTQFPADTTTGAGIVALDASNLMRAGGVNQDNTQAPTVRFSLACVSACQFDPAGDPVDLVRPAGYLLPSGDTLWIGTDASGQTTARRHSATSGVTPITLHEPRTGGSVQLTSTGQYAVLGGHYVVDGNPAVSLEFYQP